MLRQARRSYLLVFFLSWLSLQIDASQKKYVIGSRDAGLFSNLLQVLNHLQLCYDKKLTPVVYWDSGSKYYVPEGFNGSTNVWEYYFHKTSKLSYEQGDLLHDQYIIGPMEQMFWGTVCTQSERDRAHKLIQKYIKPKGKIRYKVDQFYKKYIEGKKTIGIHMRGTDKAREVTPAPVADFAALANKYPGYQFFIATDDQRLLNEIRPLLNGNIISYDCFRSEDGSPLHIKKPSFAQLGEDVLVEVLLLAKCEKLIHTLSNVSTAVLFFNPEMENLLLKTAVQTYQPKSVDLEMED